MNIWAISKILRDRYQAKKKVELELIPDLDIYIFCEMNLFQILTYTYLVKKLQEVEFFCNSQRYNKANNKYLKSSDPKQESKHVIYLDANNLYGYAISKFLPISGFKWRDPKEFDLNKHTSDSSRWYVLKVDLEYPKESGELHNDYPLALYKTEIKREMFSDYQLKNANLYSIPISNVKKLVANFFDKKKYVIHFENLQLYLRLGLKLKKCIVY